ncbi:MAG: tripartite tricarboxylate transporter substrate binding protein [Betaproteobacteria bacterium]
MKLLSAVLLAFSILPVAHAQAPYPSKPVRIIVPYPAGGYYDVSSRVLGQKFSDALGQPFVIENRPGANAIVGTELTAKSAPDGYTIMMGGIGPHAINASLYPKLSYDPVKDFAPIILVSMTPNALVAHPGVAAKTVGQLLDLARAQPGKLNYASNGSGSSVHLCAELLGTMTGTKFNHVPFKGSAPAVAATLGGQTEFAFATAGDVLGHIRGGKLRALAVTSAKRIPALADTPTMIEAGVAGYEATAWFALFAPAGTPREIVARLNAVASKALDTDEVRERLAPQGSADLVGGAPEVLGNLVKSEIGKWSKVVRESGATAD